MRYSTCHVIKAIAIFANVCWVTPVLADQQDEVFEDMDFGVAVSEVYLEEQSGRAGSADQPLSDADLNARLNDNVVYSSINGNNSIGKGAFSDSMGFPTVIQNSGNNVIIQNNTILNLTLQQ